MRVYTDMDGVLAVYEKEAYIGTDPLFLQPGKHYFRTVKPNAHMVEFIRNLKARFDEDDTNEVYILTKVKLDKIFNEHFHDKLVWANKILPEIDIEHILMAVLDKVDCVEYIQGQKLSSEDILIDDFNANLERWQEAGGTAIKYLNGLNNSDSFNGHCIDENTSVEDFIMLLSAIIN